MSMLKAGWLLPTMMMILLSSACSDGRVADVYDVISGDCPRFRSVVSSGDKNREIEAWAEQEIFSRNFSPADVRRGTRRGPGREDQTIAPGAGVSPPPRWLPDKTELRLLGPLARPDAVFIAGGRYRGVLVASRNVEKVIVAEKIPPDFVVARSGRVAVLCPKPD